MAIERRVKPSARAREQLYGRRKIIAVVAIVLVIVLVGGLAATALIPSFSARPGSSGTSDVSDVSGGASGLPTSAEASKAVLASNTDYAGVWVDDVAYRFTLYLPGDIEVKNNEFASQKVMVDSGNTSAYGVLVSNVPMSSLKGDPTADPSSVLALFVSDVVKDAGIAMYDADFSAAYDLSTYELSDGTKALWVSGDMQTSMSRQPEGATSASVTTMDFPLRGFIAVRNDYPIFVWGIANPDNKSVASNLDSYIKDCAATFSDPTLQQQTTGVYNGAAPATDAQD